MASSLEQQLQQVRNLQGLTAAPKAVKGKPSLLFDWQKAADVDLQSIHEIGCQGLDELVRLDARYNALRPALFSHAAASLAREQLDAEALAKLNQAVSEFCALLAQHFLTPGAFRALEYLIRRFKVHEHNIDALMVAALPYHSTPEFVRLLQVLALDPKRGLWHWLEKAQAPGAALPREVLVARCINDAAVLGFVCDAARKLGSAEIASKAYLSFYAVTLCEVVAGVQAVDEELLTRLLPYISAGLEAGACPDYRAATLMVVAELCSRATLGKDFVKAICNSTLKTMGDSQEEVRTVLLVLAHMAATQTQLSALPDKALKRLMGLAPLVPELATLRAAQVRVGPLLRLLTRSLVAKLGSEKSDKAEACLVEIVRAGVLDALAQALAAQLLQAGVDAKAPEGVKPAAQKVLRALDLHHPEQVDAAVNEALQPLRPSSSSAAAGAAGKAKADQDSDMDEEEEAEGGKGSPQVQALFAFIQETFHGTARAVCGDSALTLTAAAAAPAARVRAMALRGISDVLVAQAEGAAAAAAEGGSGSISSGTAQLQACVLNGLQDDDVEVVASTLALDCLPRLPAAALMPALQAAARRVAGLLFGAAKPEHDVVKHLRSAIKKAVTVAAEVAASLSASHSETAREARDVALLLVLALVLPPRRDSKAAQAAVAAASELDHPIAAAIAGLSALAATLEKAEVPEEGASGTKGKKKGAKASSSSKEELSNTKKREADRAEAKARLMAAAQAFQKAAVEAIAKVVVKHTAEVARLLKVAREQAATAMVAEASGAVSQQPGGDVTLLRARHALLLALHAALARAAPRASASDGAASAAAEASQALADACLAELDLLCSSPTATQGLGSWQERAAAVLDAAGMPQAEHGGALNDAPEATHSAAVCHMLHAALSAAPQLHLQLSAVFVSLATLTPAGAFDAHLKLLLSKATPDAAQRSSFLASLFAAPPAGAPAAAVQCTALRLLAESAQTAATAAAAGTPTKARKGAPEPAGASAEGFAAQVPCLLAAAHSSISSVRAASLQAMASVAAALEAARGSAGAAALATLLRALLAQPKLITADPDAVLSLLRNTFALGGGAAAAAAGAAAPATPPPSSGKKKPASRAGSASGEAGAKQGAPSSAATLALEAPQVEAAFTQLCSLLPTLHGADHAAHSASCTLSALLQGEGSLAVDAAQGRPAGQLWAATAAQRTALAQPALVLFDSLLNKAPQPLTPAEQHLGSLLASFIYVPEVLKQETPAAAPSAFGKAITCEIPPEAARPEVGAAWVDSAAPLRRAALEAMARGPAAELQASLKDCVRGAAAAAQLPGQIFRLLAVCSARDPSAPCRAAARAVLEQLPVGDAVVVPVLLDAMPVAAPASATPATQEEPSKKKARKGAKAEDAKAAAATAATKLAMPPAGALELAVLVLELLQWKQVQGEQRVVAAAQELLSGLQDIMAPLAERHGEEAAEAAEGEAGQEEAAAAAAAAAAEEAAAKSSLAGYAAQIILSCLEVIAKRHIAAEAAKATEAPAATAAASTPAARSSKSGGSAQHANPTLACYRLDLAVSVARKAPDAGVRNAALSLLGTLAGILPEATLGHVLQVLSIVNQSIATAEDQHTQNVATTVLAAVVPAWSAAGKDLSALWTVIVDALPSIPAHRRLGLMNSLLFATNVEDSLPVGLLMLLRLVANAMGPQQEEQEQPEQQQKDKEKPEVWALELAAKMTLQVDLVQRLHCFAGLLAQSAKEAGDAPYDVLPRVALTFVTTQIKSRAIISHHAGAAPGRDHEFQAGCTALMAKALEQVQALVLAKDALAQAVPPAPNKKTPEKAKANKAAVAAAAAADVAALGPVELKRAQRAARAAIEAVYGLFTALQGIMDTANYLQALLQLARNSGDRLRRRSLKLFADKARNLGAEVEQLSKHPLLKTKQRTTAITRLAQSATAVCGLLTAADNTKSSLAKASSLTKQAALMAFAHVAMGCGYADPQAVLAAVPAVLAHAQSDVAAVRGSGVAALAAAVRACGVQTVPHLPHIAKIVLACTDAACKLVAGASGADLEQGAGSGAAAVHPADEDDSVTKTVTEEAVVELAAGLAAMDAMVASLGPFLSPYLPAMIRVLVHPSVLRCRAAGCATAAAAVRTALPRSVPARLLLQPLFDALPDTMAMGPEPCAALLATVTSAASGMEASVAASHHEPIFAFLLKALDVRSAPPPALRGHEHEVEQQAVAALVSLTLKLSEARFKPLFLRLLEWAALPSSAAGAGAKATGRAIALMAASAALAEKLRSVFVPYYRYLVDGAVKHLGGAASDSAAGKTPKKKKAKLAAAAADLLAADADPSGADAVSRWVLRGKALRALHRCFLYDTVGFVDGDVVGRLLEPLVAQLHADPGSETGTAAGAAVLEQCADAELDATVTFGPRTPRDTYGVASVAALVALAVAANSDVHWKPLNHQVLMATRSASARTRCLALEVVSHLVSRLREEYLVLLPETLPFLAELLEDVDTSVEARAQDVLKALEEVSGEKLDQYMKTN